MGRACVSSCTCHLKHSYNLITYLREMGFHHIRKTDTALFETFATENNITWSVTMHLFSTHSSYSLGLTIPLFVVAKFQGNKFQCTSPLPHPILHFRISTWSTAIKSTCAKFVKFDIIYQDQILKKQILGQLCFKKLWKIKRSLQKEKKTFIKILHLRKLNRHTLQSCAQFLRHEFQRDSMELTSE